MAVREPQTHEPGAGGFLAGEVRAYHIGVQKGDKSLLLEGDLSPPAHTSRSCRNSVFTSAGGEAVMDPHQARAVPRAPPLGRSPGASFFHLRLRSRSPAPESAGAPASGSGARAGAGPALGHGVPPTPPWAARPGSFCGRNSPSRSLRAGRSCRAAGRRQRRRNPTAAAAPSLAASLGLAASRQLR